MLMQLSKQVRERESTCSVPVGLVEFSQFMYVHLIYVENVRQVSRAGPYMKMREFSSNEHFFVKNFGAMLWDVTLNGRDICTWYRLLLAVNFAAMSNNKDAH